MTDTSHLETIIEVFKGWVDEHSPLAAREHLDPSIFGLHEGDHVALNTAIDHLIEQGVLVERTDTMGNDTVGLREPVEKEEAEYEAIKQSVLTRARKMGLRAYHQDRHGWCLEDAEGNSLTSGPMHALDTFLKNAEASQHAS